MKMQVVSYHAGIPVVNKSPEKSDILYKYVQGVNVQGDVGVNHFGLDVVDCDIAVMQGFVHEWSKNHPHLQLRKDVLHKQKMSGKKTLVADSNLFLFLAPGNKPKNYLRYSFDGVFRKTGFYFDTDIDPNRWDQIRNDLNISVKPYRQHGNHILLCLQRNGGWSMKNYDVMKFCHETIQEIKRYTDRPIVVRGHPGDRKTLLQITQEIKYPNITVSNNKSIEQDLSNAWATVTYNSSPGVASFIHGVPVFQKDPDPDYSMYGEIANFDMSKLEKPDMPNIHTWLQRIAMCHWNFDELADGTAWKFMRNYV